MKIKVENVESEDNHVTMVDIQEGTEDIKELFFKEEFTEDLTDNKFEKTSENKSFNVNEASIKIEEVESEDNHVTMVEIQEGTDDIKELFFKEEVTEDLTDSELEKTSENKSFNVNEASIKIEEVESEDNHVTMVEIQEGTDDIKELFFKEEVTEDLTDNKFEETSENKSFNDNRTGYEANQITHACYFESRIVTYNNKETAANYNKEDDITKHRVFQCDLCQKMYKTKKQITVHLLKSHKSSTDKHCTQKLNTIHCNKFTKKTYTNINRPYKCDVCYKHFSKGYNLTIHKRVHTGEKPFKCYFCLKPFSHKSNLIRHKRVHTGEKPFKCYFCLKPFSHKSNLIRHERVHTNDKPYKCVLCLKSFCQSSDLTVHKRTHTGEKPFKCKMCLKTFYSKSYLKKHEPVHTNEKPYRCHVCPKSFTYRSSLTNHRRVHAI